MQYRFAVQSLVSKGFRGRPSANSWKLVWLGPLSIKPGSTHTGGLAFAQRNLKALKDYLKRGVVSVKYEGKLVKPEELEKIVTELSGTPKVEAPKVEAPKAETPEPKVEEAPKEEPKVEEKTKKTSKGRVKEKKAKTKASTKASKD